MLNVQLSLEYNFLHVSKFLFPVVFSTCKTEKPFFSKTFKTFKNFIWMEIFCVNRRNITIKINIWIAFSIEQIIIHCKRII